jgi:hypothetical protein
MMNERNINIVSLVETYGVKNLRFYIPMRPLEMMGFIPGIAFKFSNTPEEMTECEIDESWYKVADDYKITLVSVKNPQSTKVFGKEHFYISDLESIIERDSRYRVLSLNIDGYSQIV